MEWKDSPIFPDRYEVSDTGLIRSKSYLKVVNRQGKIIQWTTKARLLSAATNKCGYRTVMLQYNNKSVTKFVHRLVAQLFVEGCSEGLEVNHKDSDRANNNSSNLEWVTHRDNILHSYKEGLNSNAKDYHPRALLSSEIVLNMRKDFQEGFSYKDIAIKYGKLYHTVWKAIKGKNWKDIE